MRDSFARVDRGEVWLVERGEAAIPANARADGRATLSQMVMDSFAPKHRPVDADAHRLFAAAIRDILPQNR